jgi:hypothetical protein
MRRVAPTMRHLARFGLALAAIGGAAPVAASADPPWTPPQNVSAPALFAGPTLGAIAAGDGRALAYWSEQATTTPVLRWRVASRPPGSPTFGPAQPAPDDLFDVVAYGQSRTLAGFQRQIGPPEIGRTQLQVRFGRTDGTFGHATTIADGNRLLRPVIAADEEGNAALAWFADRGTSNDRVYVSLRRAGGSFGPPIQLAEGRIRSVAVAVGAPGKVLVAWDARGTIRARFAQAMNGKFDATETIRSDDTYFAQIHAAVGQSGRAYLAWSAKFLSEGGSEGPVYYEVAVRPSGKTFRPAMLLEQQPATRPQEPIGITLNGRDATVAWSGFDGTNARVRVASTDPSAHFGPPQDVSPAGSDAVLSDLETAAGRRVVAWDNGGFEANQVFAAVANPTPPPSVFGPPEAVSPAQEARGAMVVPAAPVGLVWSNRPAGSHPSGGLRAIQTYVQASALP